MGKKKTRLRNRDSGFLFYYRLKTPLPYSGFSKLRPVTLRPFLSEGLPFGDISAFTIIDISIKNL